ncbi:MAG: alpha/beta hydrolase [Erysipelotrichaceae bacterium]|nr:alpha/beta hydrolase [Erysipelotrichaceae bacterium]
MKKTVIRIKTSGRYMKCIVLKPDHIEHPLPGILWIHGGGYVLGMASMVSFSCGKMLAERYGAVVLSPEYRLAKQAPYPAALDDCYAALVYMHEHAEELDIDVQRIIVGGESAGGGLAAAVCLYNRDHGNIPVSMQMPLYPMIDCHDTASSRDNHGKVWNTKRNHWGWSNYLRSLYGTDHVPAYASPALAEDLSGMPPCCTFVADGEPFFQETLDYIARLDQAGVRTSLDVYHGDIHAFDLLCPWLETSRAAKQKLCRVYDSWIHERR